MAKFFKRMSNSVKEKFMNIVKFEVPGPILLELKSFGDSRGFFVERYRQDSFQTAGIGQNFIQENFSKSAPGVLRGLHYQFDLPQGKLVTCVMGKIWDVAVDIRRDSPTFGRHVAVTLDSDKPSWFWVPPGFAHGFCVLGSDPAGLLYKVDNYYNANGEGGIMWSDPTLNIPWPVLEPTISAKDLVQPSFKDYSSQPKF